MAVAVPMAVLNDLKIQLNPVFWKLAYPDRFPSDFNSLYFNKIIRNDIQSIYAVIRCLSAKVVGCMSLY